MKRKVLIVIDSLTGGGAEKVLYDILKRLDKDKFIIDVFLFSKSGVYLERVKKEINKVYGFDPKIKDKTKLISLIKNRWRKIYRFLVLKKMIPLLPNNYDVEIAFLEGESTKFISERKNKAKKIAWIHTDLAKHRVLSKEVEKEVYKGIDKIICVSNDSKNNFIEIYPEFKEKVEVIYNLIAKDEILEKSSELNEKANQPTKITIISVGRLISVKGYDILLKAHKINLNLDLDYNLRILGEGSLKDELLQYIKQSKIENNTEILEFKENPYPFMKNADIFVLSSRYEGLPLVLCEALVLGLPIISTNCVGPKELLKNGEIGKIVEVEDVENLALAIRELIEDEEKRIYYSKMSKDRAKIFDESETIRKIEVILQ
ncbi:glycosyltransferase [uncultured Cetobacterium sp.]|uniref:glycosyltransferase n=1 Tax=uncultured Cetobacterium sp. TaxID=527638 RepID=UPI0025F5B8AA|nr:glycosyltransferase [uncultured Cetobacterium sp.]